MQGVVGLAPKIGSELAQNPDQPGQCQQGYDVEEPDTDACKDDGGTDGNGAGGGL